MIKFNEWVEYEDEIDDVTPTGEDINKIFDFLDPVDVDFLKSLNLNHDNYNRLKRILINFGEDEHENGYDNGYDEGYSSGYQDGENEST